MKPYDHKQVERTWQEAWEQSNIYAARDMPDKRKFYALVEFPYPSGDGLHTGHIRSYTAMDIIARKRRMEGYEVLYPMGWDAFGLPTENYAIKTGIHPREVTRRNTDTFRRQLKSVGFSFDWSREINTSDPEYYKWTQWIFIKLFEHGLAYKARSYINWCTSCKIGLANEEVVNGACERCGGETQKREKEQWMLAITKYAQRLLDDLDDVDYPEAVKTQQRNWIGRSEGARIAFPILGMEGKTIEVFTTRPDTIFGATYLVVAPDHPLIEELGDEIGNIDEVRAYVREAVKKTDMERTAEDREKTGVPLRDVKAVNPINKAEIPVYVADYVLATYGTGAIMAVPAHDERDYAFAQTYGLPIVEVIEPADGTPVHLPFTGRGKLVNSGSYDGMDSEEAKRVLTEAAGGELTVTYRLRDWVFSRQRYWGEPIPMVECADCGAVPVPESELPVTLPEVERYVPTETGESPLAAMEEWVRTTCPECGGPARRETDVMPNWAGSSWYFLRYIDPHAADVLVDPEKERRWMPVDWYNGGMEHTTLHLLYSRFWHKFLYDIGVVHGKEPYKKRTSHGMILAEGGVKMSKSKGNVVNPDEIVATYGADTLRVYEMFMGPFDQAIAWDPKSIIGVRRFLEKVWRIGEAVRDTANDTLERSLHRTIKKVSEDIEHMKFNTAVSAMMVFATEAERAKSIGRAQYHTFLRLLAPFAPHIAEELWHETGGEGSVHRADWPTYRQELLEEEEVTLVVQVNGKVRDSITVCADISRDEAERLASEREKVRAHIAGRSVRKIIYVPKRIINFVV